jgi:ABC-type nitrate/sulfonate/bicarbonate transport system substrate-binding protein
MAFTRRRFTALLALPLVAALGLAACATPADTAAPEEDEPRTLRVAFGSQPDFTGVNNYKWIEDMEADGVVVEQLFFESSQDAFRALVVGEADVAPTGIISAVLLNLSGGEDVRVIAADIQAPSYLLVSTADITSDEQLVGKQVGISTPGDVSDTLTRYVFGLRGIDTDAVEFVEIGGTGARLQALLQGQISAGIAHAAEGLTAIEQGDLNYLYSFGEYIPGYLQHGLMAMGPWIDENEEFAQYLVDGFIETTRWAADNKDEYIELSKKYIEGLDDDIRGQAYDIYMDAGIFGVNGGMDRDQLEGTIEIEESLGTFGNDSPPAIEVWADTRFVEDYLDRNGRR